MKNWLAQNKFLCIAVIALALVSISAITVIALSPQTTSSQIDPSAQSQQCSAMTDSLSKSDSLQFHPIKILAEPWRGEHHVYAIFALPLQYQKIYHRSQLLVKGNDTPWQITPTDGRKYGVAIPQGHFLVIGFFRTRLALWYWANGRFGDLQQPCNWTLHLFPK
ncbi:hypothetical protein [Pseudanabaena sp. 'Roaring Creek']|uniref:hypothetical protein n=1 Tax=Pseudanabaena sp. 'Roaring Creek' TaxID=1681830 RepID=UPI0006D83B60|nr:hypothetical protein [Pseudanabaena sp. 'Roaring Creek']